MRWMLVLVALVIILLAGAARVALALNNHHALYDEVLVMEMADQLVKGQGYTLEFIWFPALAHQGWPQPDPQIMPLLPTLVATAWQLVGQSVPVANAVTAVVAAICVLVAFLMAWRVAGPGAGLLAALVLLVNSRYLHVSITALTSPVYGLFLTLTVWAFGEAMEAAGRWRIGWWAWTGVLGGLAWLTRPEGPLIPPALVLTVAYLWWRRRDSGRWLLLGFLLAVVLFVLVASPLIAYNLTNYGTITHATGKVNQWSPDYDARFSLTPPTAAAYWATHTPGDFLAVKVENLTWMLSLLAEYLTGPGLALLLAAAGLAVWRASPLTAVVVYTLVFLAASLSQSTMSIWPGSQYFMYYSGLLPLWTVLMAWGTREFWRILGTTPVRRAVLAGLLTVGLILTGTLEGPRIASLVSYVGRSQIVVADPRLHDFRWMADHIPSEAIVMTWDPHNLHWYSDHRRAVMIPADDARTIQAFMQRRGVTHFYYNDWLVRDGRRPVLRPLQQLLYTGRLGPYSILQPVYSGEGLLFQVDFAGPPALLLVNPAAGTGERIAQTWLRYAVTDTVPADLSAYPAVIAGDTTPGLAGRYQPVGARFGEGIELAGYQIQSQSSHAQSTSLQVYLYWRCRALVDKDYTVFNHLLDAAGAWVAQQDGPPASGFYPTSRWHPGEVIVDRHVITLQPDTPPGAYRLAVGLYEFATMQRLPVQGGSDAVTLALIVGSRP